MAEVCIVVYQWVIYQRTGTGKIAELNADIDTDYMTYDHAWLDERDSY
jgi:hypothetical protein